MIPSRHSFRRLSILNLPSSHFYSRTTMPPKVDTEALFKSEAFAVQYKVAETFTGPFGQSLIEQTKLVEDAKATPGRPIVVLDSACGTGIISSLLNEKLDSSIRKSWRLTCGDISTPLLEYTACRMKEEDWQNAETKVVNVQETGLPSDHFTHVFSGFGKLIYVCLLYSTRS